MQTNPVQIPTTITLPSTVEFDVGDRERYIRIWGDGKDQRWSRFNAMWMICGFLLVLIAIISSLPLYQKVGLGLFSVSLMVQYVWHERERYALRNDLKEEKKYVLLCRVLQRRHLVDRSGFELVLQVESEAFTVEVDSLNFHQYAVGETLEIHISKHRHYLLAIALSSS